MGKRLGLLGVGSLCALSAVWVLAMAGSAAASPSNCSQVGSTVTCTFMETGGNQTWTVPPGVTTATVTLYGANGGAADTMEIGGSGAEVQGTLTSLTANQSFTLVVGGAGPAGPLLSAGVAPSGGFNGGGAGSCDCSATVGGFAGGGGGATDLLSGTTTLLVAGGGGGAGGNKDPGTSGGPGGNADTDGTAGTALHSQGSTWNGGGGGSSGEHGGGGGTGGTASTSCDAGDFSGGQGASASGTTGGGAAIDGGGGGGGGQTGGGQGGGGGKDNCEDNTGGWGGGGGGSSSTAGVPGATVVTDSPTVQASMLGGNGEAVISYTAPPPADLSITNSAPSSVHSGNQFTYTIVATNTGALDASNVAVNDALPATAHFVSVSTTQGTCTEPSKRGGGTVACTIGSLGGGTSATITIVVHATRPDTLTDTATVSASGVTPDQDDSASAATTVTGGD